MLIAAWGAGGAGGAGCGEGGLAGDDESGADKPPAPPRLLIDPRRVDLDRDGRVGGSDVGLLLARWGESATIADVDRDGDVDGADLGLLLAAWGE